MQRAKTLTLADAVLPGTGLLKEFLLIGGFAAFVALAAQVRIYLPFTPVPITAQTLAVLVTGAVLGSRRGLLSQLLYFGAGAAGLPVFQGFHGGFSYLQGATAGYLVGFVLAAYVVGLLAERGWDRRYLALPMLMVGNVILFIPGLLWLWVFLGFAPWGKVLALGLLPFIPGDLVKLALGAIALPSAWALVRRWR